MAISITNRDQETGHNDFWCTCGYGDGDCLCICDDCQEESLRCLMEEAPSVRD